VAVAAVGRRWRSTAFAFAVDQNGTVDGFTLNSGAGTFGFTSGFVAPVIPANDPGVGMVVAQKKFVYAASNWITLCTVGPSIPPTGA